MSLTSACYRKNSKNWDTWNNYHNCPTIGTVGFYSAVLCTKDADRITNREDPDQTAPSGAVWSGSALFAQTYLSQYLKLLRYCFYASVGFPLLLMKNDTQTSQYCRKFKGKVSNEMVKQKSFHDINCPLQEITEQVQSNFPDCKQLFSFSHIICSATKEIPLVSSLSLKVAMTTAADNSFEYFFIVFQRK